MRLQYVTESDILLLNSWTPMEKTNIWIKQAKPHTASIKQHGFIVKVYRWCTGLPAVQPFLSQQFLDFNRLLLKEQVILHSAEHGPVPIVV